ncbi:MAG TPA: DUF1491 family protein [Sphingomicrobium sp.]|nr:DUF1491 family protein [Sphingomicrobium sp.]
MTDDRLPASVEATGLLRRIEAQGDFGTLLSKGDPDRGALILVVSSRGRHVACLERNLSPDGKYRWRRTGPAESAGPGEIAEFLARQRQIDSDLWLIELDIALPERFIAETIGEG